MKGAKTSVRAKGEPPGQESRAVARAAGKGGLQARTRTGLAEKKALECVIYSVVLGELRKGDEGKGKSEDVE
ncbi:MAG: hypothetical protein ABSE25_14695 [Syntrophorhabdales bacterium]|jgi:hypothetical protein